MPVYWIDFLDKQLKEDSGYCAHYPIQEILEQFFKYLVEEDVIRDDRMPSYLKETMKK